MSRNSDAFRRAVLRAPLITALGAPVTACADAPDWAARPDPRPDPAAQLREDWLDWQRDRGGTYREFLREQQEAERQLREEAREQRHERLSPEPDGEGLAERLEAERRESFERLEERTPEQRLRPETLRRNRPGLRN